MSENQKDERDIPKKALEVMYCLIRINFLPSLFSMLSSNRIIDFSVFFEVL